VSALDLSVQAQILDLLQELQERLGLSYLFISHDLDVVEHMCDETVVLYRGRVLEVGRTAELAQAPLHPYTQALQDAVPLPNPRTQRQRRATSRTRTGAGLSDAACGCVFAPRCPSAAPSCWSQEPPLRRVVSGAVACDRFPEWRAESMSQSNGGNKPSHEFQLPEVR
jgi:oligopeptide/dipeptide ABC transporter ATP-binding protein